MSLLYGSLKGSAKTEATRRGTTNSGIEAHVRGWDSGIKVVVNVSDEGTIIYSIFSTSGSKGVLRDKHIATLSEKEITENSYRVYKI